MLLTLGLIFPSVAYAGNTIILNKKHQLFVPNKTCPPSQKINGVCVTGHFVKQFFLPITPTDIGVGIVGGLVTGIAANMGDRIINWWWPKEKPKPKPIVLEPWTQKWLDYCKKKYKSFDLKTGTYNGNDSKKHFCT